MSLTRAEWVQMWGLLKKIEKEVESLEGKPRTKNNILVQVDSMKVYIESEIGQLE